MLAAFTSGDLAVLQAAASANNTTVSVLEIGPAAASQSSTVQTIAISGAGANAIRVSGSASTTLYLSHTNDDSLLTFNGVNTTNTSGNINTMNPRAVVTVDANGNVINQTTYTGVSGEQTRSATSLDDATWFIADQGGLYSNGTSTPDPAGNFRSEKSFAGTVYVLQQSATNPVISTVSAPTGGTVTGLPGLSSDNSAVDFYMVSSGQNGSAYDELYITTANNTGTIEKYSLINGTWTAEGTADVGGGLFGIAASNDPTSGVDLYVTTGGGATTGNSVLKFVDSAAWNTPISLGAATTLFTTSGSTILKGIDFAPASGGQQLQTPVVSSPSATAIASSTVTLNANVISGGISTITERGFVYAKTTENANPQIGAAGVTRVIVSGTTGALSTNLSGLIPGIGYSFTAYATNSQGTGYTSPATFLTFGGAVTVDNTLLAGTSGAFSVTTGHLKVAADPTVTITYTLAAVPAAGFGTLSKDGTALGMNDTFTQADIDAGKITFSSAASNSASGSFKFTASDGNGDSIPQTTFNINVVATKPFEPGDLVIYHVGDGLNALSANGSQVFIDEYTPTGTLVQSIPLSDGASGATNNLDLIASGTAASEGEITTGPDGRLAIVGYDAALGGSTSLSGTASTVVSRAVGLIDASGMQTDYGFNDFSTGNNPRSAVVDGNNLYLSGGAGGVTYVDLSNPGVVAGAANNASTQILTGGLNAPTSIHQVNIFGGQLYASSNSTTGFNSVALGAVGTGLPTTDGQSLTSPASLLNQLHGNGATDNPSPYSFFFADLDGSPGYDTVYIADDFNSPDYASPGISKWSLVDGNWTETGVILGGNGQYHGLTGIVSGTTVELFATDNLTSSSKLVEITDASGYNGTLAATPMVLTTAPANTAFRGVAFAPYVLGDMNQNSSQSVSDVNALMMAMTDQSTYKQTHGNMSQEGLLTVADVNRDGYVNNADIQALISLLANNTTGGVGDGSGNSGGASFQARNATVTAPVPTAVPIISIVSSYVPVAAASFSADVEALPTTGVGQSDNTTANFTVHSAIAATVSAVPVPHAATDSVTSQPQTATFSAVTGRSLSAMLLLPQKLLASVDLALEDPTLPNLHHVRWNTEKSSLCEPSDGALEKLFEFWN